MQTLDGPKWQVNVDAPMLLQFASYVGEQEGFSPRQTDGRPQASPAEAEWQDWWESVVLDPTDLEASAALFARAPEFEPLAAKPLLREICRSRWDGFLKSWRTGKPTLVERLEAQTGPLAMHEIVRQQERRLGRRSRDFRWRLCFVWWPESYLRDVSASPTVLGAGYLEPSRLADLRALVHDRIVPLV